MKEKTYVEAVKNCKQCGRELSQLRLVNGQGKFCSQTCKNKYHYQKRKQDDEEIHS